MNNVFEVRKSLFKTLNEYITTNSQFNPKVSTFKIDKITQPLVVFTEMSNIQDLKSTHRKILTRNLNYYINIYAIQQDNISALQICEELAQLVLDVMQGYYGMNGGLTTAIPRYDGQAVTYQFVMTFTTKVNVNSNLIY